MWSIVAISLHLYVIVAIRRISSFWENIFFYFKLIKKKQNRKRPIENEKKKKKLENKAKQHKIGNLFKFQIIYEQNNKKMLH